MLQAIGDTFWKVGQTFYQTGEVIGKTIVNVATCQPCGQGQKIVEAGEQLKHDTEVLLTEKEQLESNVAALQAKLAEVEATAGASSAEAGEKLNTQISDLKDQVSDLEDQAMADLAKNEGKLDSAVQALKLAEGEVQEAEKVLASEADVTKKLNEEIAKLKSELAAAKKAKK